MKPSDVMRLIEKQDFRCALSGRILKPESASLRHRVPLSRGGEHALANAIACDRMVAEAKASLTVEEFVGLCCEVAEWAASGAADKFARPRQ